MDLPDNLIRKVDAKLVIGNKLKLNQNKIKWMTQFLILLQYLGENGHGMKIQKDYINAKRIIISENKIKARLKSYQLLRYQKLQN